MKTYLFSYGFRGRQYSMDVKADSLQEAEERIKMMPWAKNDGILFARIPVISGRWLILLAMTLALLL